MRYLSVCSGIEAATVAWHPLGWQPAAFSEIDAFPCAVLQHHYPHTPLHGDFTTIQADQYGPVDLLVGGTPCQSFSVAGLRLGLDDPRGNLALGFVQLAQRLAPRWIVWENVPGALSSGSGRDFGAITGALAELGYSFAYRVLDAQFFGVPQRRRRVFLVGHSSGDWRRPAAVLFEPESLRRDTPPSRSTGEEAAGDAEGSTGGQPYRVANCLTRRMHKGINSTLDEGQAPVIGFYPTNRQPEFGNYENVSPAVKVGSGGSAGNPPGVCSAMRVRRLTPIECERLQGFPDGYTQIPWRNKPADQCPDGNRYKALGNSMAVPVMRWIGARIAQVDS
jgi:DNA (cytosine-5)-methyltransferase 1